MDRRKLSSEVHELVTSVFAPFLSLLCVCCMFKGFKSISNCLGLIPSESTLGIVLGTTADVILYFLPLFIAYNLAVNLKLYKLTAVGIGLTLLYFPIYASANGFELTSVFGIDISSIAYSSTVLPAICAVAVAYYLEKIFGKVFPKPVSHILVPICVLLIDIPITYAVVGPVANQISNGLASMLKWLLTFSPVLGGAFAGFFWQIFVVLGIHQALTVPSIINLSSGVPDTFFALVQCAPFAQGVVVLAMWLKTKERQKKPTMMIAWFSGIIFGITEPAIYGYTLSRPKLFLLGCLSSAIGGAYLGFSNILLYRMGGSGIFVFQGITSKEGIALGVINLAIGWIVTASIAMVGTWVLYRDEATEEIEIYLPAAQDISGEINQKIINA